MSAGIAQPAAAHPAAGGRGQGVGRSLYRGALHIVKDPANTAHLFAAAGAARAPVDQWGERRAVARGLFRARSIHDQDAAMVRREPEDDSAGEGIIGTEYRRRQTALAAPGERNRLVRVAVWHHRRDRTEGL